MEMILNAQGPRLLCEESAFPGVRRVCGMVLRDWQAVFGGAPGIIGTPGNEGALILAATIGRSPLLDDLEARGRIDLREVRGKWEVYTFQLIDRPFEGVARALIIAGSDKRGTIYGLFHLSELMGVSPLTDWAEVHPARRDILTLDEGCCCTTKEPSVRYRGIFINDEWPAIGNWAKNRFGDFNAAMYLHVFELLLRLKGNYLWPAMWHSCFSLDGPGLQSAELADELGIVMGTSHHEPCMRAGEEYRMVQGPDSIYGDAWNFRTNREGITRFWEDGLKRNRPFENIITVGMRGEQDTPIMGKDATLQDNIDLLRDVLKTQNELIRRHVNPDLTQVQRLFVLFTEVEAFYYGDAQTPGLMGDPELDGVTLMLTDDNFGNLRSLPTPAMRSHPGGFGLYYHLDFHGGAYAYDWMNTDYLPKMWEQLTQAYEGGIRQVWIANLGDIAFLEYPLCYFMDLAYDIDRHGAPNQTPTWSRAWVAQQFGGAFCPRDCDRIDRVLNQYMLINHNRKPEVMNLDVYHPVHEGETERLLQVTESIQRATRALLKRCPQEMLDAFWELVYYPAAASANHCRMWLCAARNAFCAPQGRRETNRWADAVRRCIARDRELTRQYHELDNGRFYGFALSEHVGFVRWCEDGCLFPPMTRIEPANKPRLLVADALSDAFVLGTRWTTNTVTLPYALHPGVEEVAVDLACASRDPVPYRVETDCPWIALSHTEGCARETDRLTMRILRDRLPEGVQEGLVMVHTARTHCRVVVQARNIAPGTWPEGTFVESCGVICMEASHAAERAATPQGAYVTLAPYGRTGSAEKAFPIMHDFSDDPQRPSLTYRFAAEQDGDYELCLYVAPSNTATMEHLMLVGVQMNDGEPIVHNLVGPDFASLKLDCQEWDAAVRNNIRISRLTVPCHEGVNTLTLYAMSPMAVLERLVLHPVEREIPASYLGPQESWRA